MKTSSPDKTLKKSRLHLMRLAALVFVPALSVFAQDIIYSGNFMSQAGIGLPNTHQNKGDFLLGQNSFNGSIRSYYEESMIYINAQLVHDAMGGQSTNGHSAFVSEDGSYALKIKEAYIDWKNELIALRFGRQIASWGKADKLQITDVLCPKDLSDIITNDFSESRLGIDAIRLSLYTERTLFDVYYIPFFTPSILPLAKKSPLRPYLFPDQKAGIDIIAPYNYNDFDIPEKKLSNGEFGLRSSVYTSFADFSLYGFYGWDDTPFIEFEPSIDEDLLWTNGELGFDEIYIFGKYKRMAMIGIDAAIPIGEFVLRLEGAYFPNRHFQTEPEYQIEKNIYDGEVISSLKKHQVLGLTGFDWIPSGGWTVTAQYEVDLICNYDNRLNREKFNHQVTLSIGKSVLNETLSLITAGVLDLKEFSSVSKLGIDYKLNDAITLSAIADIFLQGPDNKKGTYGKYRDLSVFKLKGQYSF